MRERPQNFVLDYNATLARGLVFAGLAGGNCSGSKTYYDSSPRKNHGALTNMVPGEDWTWIPELGRWGWNQDGTADQYVNCPSLRSITQTSFTVHLWVSGAPYNADHYGGVYDRKDPGTYFMIERPGWSKLRMLMRHNYGSTNTIEAGSTGAISDASRMYAVTAVKYSNVLCEFFLDAVSLGTGTETTGNATGSSWNTKIGYHYLGGWNGNLADALVWHRALTLPEIQILADRSDPMLSGLVKPPKRKYYGIYNTPYSKRYFSIQTSIGAFAFQT